MTYALIHPSIFINVAMGKNAKETNKAIHNLIEWSNAHTSKRVDCRTTSYFKIKICETIYYPEQRLFEALHGKFSDGSWHPFFVMTACYPLLNLEDADDLFCKTAHQIISTDINVSPRLYADDDPDVDEIEKFDSAKLAIEKKNQGSKFDWIIAAVNPQYDDESIELHIDGKAVISHENDKTNEIEVKTDLKCYLCPPPQPAAIFETESERIIKIVKAAIQGKSALLMGYPEVDISCLGFERTKFLANRYHGENIKNAERILRQGTIHFFIHLVEESTHDPSNLKDRCSDEIQYVVVRGNPSVEKIARAIARVLHLD